MSDLFQAVRSFFAPKSCISFRISSHPKVIETVNECGEKRYIEMDGILKINERREKLETLLTKCIRLISFVEKKKWDEGMYNRILLLKDDIRLSMYKSNDIEYLIKEFKSIENFFKMSSKSKMNLSGLDSV